MKKLSAFAKKRFKLLTYYLKDFESNPQTEFIHKIRLEIKKIKALLQVTQFCIRNFDGHEHFVPIRTIFRMAGEIRLTDVLDKLSLQNKKRVRPIQAEQISSFQKEIPELVLIVKNEKKEILHSMKKVKRACFEKYLRNKKRELKSKLNGGLDPSELHKTRKVAKEILYLSAVDKTEIKKLDPFYDNVQELIGRWHDKQVSISMLKEKKNRQERQRLISLCRKELANIKRLASAFYGSYK